MTRSSAKPPSRPTREWTRPSVDEDIKSHPIPVAGFLGALSSAAFGLVITFLVVIAAWLIAAHGDESVNQVTAASGVAWLALQLVPVSIGGHALGLLPWGFIVVPIFLIWRGTHWSLKSAGPSSAKEFWQTAFFFSISYGLVSALVALFASTDSLGVNVIDAMLRSTLLALCVSVACVVTFAPSRSILIDSLPDSIAQAIKPGVVTFLFLFVTSGVLSTISLVIHFKEMTAVMQVMAPQALDGFFLTLLSIGYLPTAIVWTMSYALGPGITIGQGIVSISQVKIGALPAFPLLSMLPSSAPSWAKYLIAVPVLAGCLLYFTVPREHWSAQEVQFTKMIRSLVSPKELVTYAMAIAVTSTCVLLVSIASSGSLGAQLLKFVGPQPFVVFSTTAIILSIVVGLLLFLPRLLLGLFYLWQHRGQTEPE